MTMRSIAPKNRRFNRLCNHFRKFYIIYEYCLHKSEIRHEGLTKLRYVPLPGGLASPLYINVLSESFLHLLLWPIFCQLHPNFINVHTVYASEIWAQLTKNLLTKSSTKRFREYILPGFLCQTAMIFYDPLHLCFTTAGSPPIINRNR